MEDFRHWKENVLEAIGGTNRHADFLRYVGPLVEAPTFEEFDAVAEKLSKTMPPQLWRYLNQGAGPANRSVLQRTKCKLTGVHGAVPTPFPWSYD